MKKMILLFVMIASVVSCQAMTSNTVACLMKSRVGRSVLRERLRQKRLEILGLKTTKETVVPPGLQSNKRLLGSSATRRPIVLTAPRSDDWEYTVTTNEQGLITKVATKGTNTVMMIWNSFIVPMRYRTRFPELTDEQRSMIAGYVDDLTPWTEKDPVDPFKDPKKVEEKKTDSNTTEEIREIQVRGW